MDMLDTTIPENINIAGIDLIDMPGFIEFVFRFTLNLGVILLIVRWLYYSTARRKEYLFTYILISSVIFMLCFLLESVKLQIGFALGLFAIFGIIRYRTDSMPIKEMTYLFLVIGISVINALTSTKTSLADLLFTNVVLILLTFGFEKIWLQKREVAKNIIYEKIALIKPEKYNELIDDLRDRTGIQNINRVEIGKIDFLRDICNLTIFYESTSPASTEIECDGLKVNDDDDDDE
jgi:hypothetical protein